MCISAPEHANTSYWFSQAAGQFSWRCSKSSEWFNQKLPGIKRGKEGRIGGKENWRELPRLCWLSQQDFFISKRTIFILRKLETISSHHILNLRVPLATKKHGVCNSPADTCYISLSRTLVPATSSWRFISSQRLRALSSTGCPISVTGLGYPGHPGGCELATPVSVKCFVFTFQFAFEICYYAVNHIFCVCWSCFSWRARSYRWPVSWLT